MNHSNIASKLTCGLLAVTICAPMGAFAQNSPAPAPSDAPVTAPPTAPAPKAPPVGTTPPGGTNPPLGTTPQNNDLNRSRTLPNRQTPQPGAPAVAQPNTAPAIKFDPLVLELGDLVPEVAKTASISVTNITDHPIKITKIQPSCGCTTTSAPPGPIAPGETTKVDITLKPPAKGGSKVSKNVTFMVEGHAPQVLQVEGFVKEYVNVTPDVLTGPSAVDTPPATVRLTSKDQSPIKVTGSSPDVFVSLPAEAGLTHDLQVDWKKWTDAGKPAKIAIMTDHPQAGQVSMLVKRSITDSANMLKQPVTPTTTVPAIVQATRDGNKDKVAEALKSGADIEATESSSQRTALHFAADKGDVDMVKILLAAKANPNAPDRTGRSPLTIAANNKHAEVLKLLIGAGGNIELRDQMGGTPVLWAAGLGSPDTVKILVDAGANPNVVDRQGMTPLIWAASVGKPDVVEYLIAKGADVKAKDTIASETALIRAVRTGSPDSVKILLKNGADLSTRNNQNMTPFLVACYSGDLTKIKMLIDAGADKSAKDSRGWGAIDFARNRLDPAKGDVIKFLEPIVPASTAVAPPQTKDPVADGSSKSN